MYILFFKKYNFGRRRQLELAATRVYSRDPSPDGRNPHSDARPDLGRSREREGEGERERERERENHTLLLTHQQHPCLPACMHTYTHTHTQD
jgi:hypothetical protein